MVVLECFVKTKQHLTEVQQLAEGSALDNMETALQLQPNRWTTTGSHEMQRGEVMLSK